MAVVSCDIIGSTVMSKKQLSNIQDTVTTLLRDHNLSNYIFQGDSFVFVSPAELIYQFLILLRLTLISIKSNPDTPNGDVKMSIAIGTVKKSSLANIRKAQDIPFIISGRNLNDLNNSTELSTLKIESTNPELNIVLDAIVIGLENTLIHLTPKQALTTKLALNGLTQKEIGQQLTITQQAVQKILQAAGYKIILKYQNLFLKAIQLPPARC